MLMCLNVLIPKGLSVEVVPPVFWRMNAIANHRKRFERVEAKSRGCFTSELPIC